MSATFDDPNLVSSAGLVPVMRIAAAAGLQSLADERLSVPTDKGANEPSGVFNANAAWLILAVIAFNLTRATGTICGGDHARATTGTLRRKIITIPARLASSARKTRLHLPVDWPWENAWTVLFERALSPPAAVPS